MFFHFIWPGVNSIKKLQVYFTSWTVVFTSPDKVEFNKSPYKFPLQASNLYLQGHFTSVDFTTYAIQ